MSNELENDIIDEEDFENIKEVNKKVKKNKENDKIEDLSTCFWIKDWFIIELYQKDVKNNDYKIYSKNWSWFFIVDLDKRKLRPYVLDLLRQMNIETLMSRLVKITFFIVLIILTLSMVLYAKIWNIQKSNEAIKTQILQNQKNSTNLIMPTKSNTWVTNL